MFECAFEVVMFSFMESVHVELSYKTVHFVMPEVFGEHYFLKFDDILYGKLSSVG
jgi:hypothetical protein